MVAFAAVIDASKEDGMETFCRRTPPKGSVPLKGGLEAPEYPGMWVHSGSAQNNSWKDELRHEIIGRVNHSGLYPLLRPIGD